MVLPLLVLIGLARLDPVSEVKFLGGIEIGGRTIKATALEIRPGGLHRTLYTRTHETTLSTLDPAGDFRTESIDDATRTIVALTQAFRETYRIPPENIHIVASSSVPQARNRPDLVKAVHKATGRTLAFIDERAEVALRFAGLVPRKERDEALVMDLGGASTKGGYRPSGKPVVCMTIPLGTTTFTEKARALARKNKVTLAAAASSLREAEVVGPLRVGAKALPGLEQRKKVYLSGGIVWAMVTFVRPEAIDDPDVRFTKSDVDAFFKLVHRAPARLPEVDLSNLRDEGQRARARAALSLVSKAHSHDQLVAGAVLLRALAEVIDFENRIVIFPRNAVFGWLTAYVAGESGLR